jgi:hypothetical protein
MKLTNKLPLRGTPKIELVYPDGTRKLHWQEENLITLSAKQALLSFLYLPSLTSDPVNKLWVGSGGTIDPAGQFPKPVPANPTSLFIPVIGVNTSYTVDNTMPSVTFIADVDQGTANGILITEAGLYKTSGLIFNMKTFPGIPKTSEFSVHFEWTIEMA